MKIKIFESTNKEELEKEVNEWLETYEPMDSQLGIVNLCFPKHGGLTYETRYFLTVFYSDK